jgi:aryl-alcohol dehydrogenase-like predicted oxidoreductase
MGECDKTTTFEILDFFYASGGNFIDTANMYMLGESECWLGEWMTDRNVRDQMIVGTKYSISTRDLNTDPEGSILSNYAGNSKKSLRLSLDQSLKNLQTDYVDILYVHAWEGLCSIEELMRALDDLVRAGKVLYLGVSNWPAWVVVKANAYARQHGLTTFVVYQGRWNPADRDIERDVIPMCKHEGIGITAWGALGGGKFKRANSKDSDGRHFTDDLGGASLETFQKCGHVMDKIGKTKGCDAIAVALRYVMLKVC